jgi:hypothetical protein
VSADQLAWTAMSHTVEREALFLSFLDRYFSLAIAMLLIVPLVLLMRRKAQPDRRG